ncbi:MAG: trans-4-hydroxy-L-proline dehydratase [Desulfobacterales bacterium]
MTPRIRRMRRASMDAIPSITAERALLATEFMQSGVAAGDAVPVRRARLFQYILERKRIWIGEGELIVGERGPAPKATPTYPEVCLHTLEDLDVLASRPKVCFAVDETVREAYRDRIIPFWQGRTVREKIFSSVSRPWISAFEAGVFTEFQEQRSPGHTALGDKIYHKGFTDLLLEIDTAEAALDYIDDPAAFDRKETLCAMRIAAKALIRYAERHAEVLENLSAVEADPGRVEELRALAAICRKVPARAPDTFWEALQYYWFVHVGVITELNPWDAFNPGRLDQHLYPFFRKEMDDGSLSRERAAELLQALWIKFNNHPAPPKVGITAKESNTYVDFALINVGGVKADGSDAVNELSYLILDVVEEMRLLQPSAMIQLSKKNPDRLLRRALDIVKTGFGQPSIFNTDAIVQELVRQGKTIEDARCGGASGCVESGAFGNEAYILTGYFNLPKVLEITLHNGKDPRTGRQIGIETGSPTDFDCFEALLEAFSRQLRHLIDIKIQGNNVIERINAKYMPVPFLSLLIDDCIANCRDYNAGGARYNTSYIQGVGIGTLTDSLSSIRWNVFEKKLMSLGEWVALLDADFEGREALRLRIIEDTPRYGNDDERADDLLRFAFECFYQAVNGKPNTRGGHHRINLLPTTSHVYFGSVTGATPDGRKAGAPLSEGISPVQGADRRGPTAVLKSAAKLDHVRTGGTLLNQKFIPQILRDEAGLTRLASLVRAYFRMDGHHIQFNVVDADLLRLARREPENYRDLIVRVAGYSDYFVDLTPELQEEIIRRTAHDGFGT